MPSTLAERSYLLGDQTLLTIEDDNDEGEGILDPKYVRRQRIYYILVYPGKYSTWFYFILHPHSTTPWW